MGRVGTIVALDPAKDSAALGGRYNESQINFAAVSNESYAFHSSGLEMGTLQILQIIHLELLHPKDMKETVQH